MATSEVGACSGAPASDQSSASSRTCSGCKKPTKDHFGPYGKDRCVITVLDVLRSRVEELEAKIVDNEARHAKELMDQACLYEKRMNGLLALVESLQEVRDDKMTVRSSAGNFASMEETMPDGEPKSLQRIVDGRLTAAVVFGSASEAVSANTRETESIRKGSAISPEMTSLYFRSTERTVASKRPAPTTTLVTSRTLTPHLYNKAPTVTPYARLMTTTKTMASLSWRDDGETGNSS